MSLSNYQKKKSLPVLLRGIYSARVEPTLAATHFLCVLTGLGERLKILAAHALSAAKRLFGIPDFNCYSLADGIRSIFSRCGHAPITPRQHAPPDQRQLSLFLA